MTTPAPTPLPVRALLEFAGFALCQGLWSRRNDEPLPPLVMLDSDEGRALMRVPADTGEQALMVARGNAASLSRGLPRTGVLYDGLVRSADGRRDAVVVEVFARHLPSPLLALQRYREADQPGGFAIVGRPIVRLDGLVEPGLRWNGFIDRGIAQHPAAGEMWPQHWIAEDDTPLRRTA